MIPLPAWSGFSGRSLSARSSCEVGGRQAEFGFGRWVRERTQRSGASCVLCFWYVWISDWIASDWWLGHLRDFAPPRMLYISSE